MLQYPLLHTLAMKEAEGRDWPVTMNELPWNHIVRTVFTRAADLARLSCRGKPFDPELLELMLEHQGLNTLPGLKQALGDLAQKAEAVRLTMNMQIPAGLLMRLTRPGAWLLDTVFTMLLILAKEVPCKRLPDLQYDVVPNKKLAALADRVFPPATEPRSLNNIGNSVEHLAWLLLEADRCDIILALAWHARQM